LFRAEYHPIGWVAQSLCGADLAESNDDKAGEGDGYQQGGREAVELLDFSIEEGEADEDEDDVGAEDFEGGFAEGQEGLAEDHADDQFAGPVEDAAEGKEIDEAQWADLPLVEGECEVLGGEVGAKPVVPDADEEEADRGGEGEDKTRKPGEGKRALRGGCTEG